MKKLLLAFSTLLCLYCSAQARHIPANVQPQTTYVFMDYVVRITSSDAGRYSYTIQYKEKEVLHQSLNPFNPAQKGLARKEDAIKVARWQIQQLHSGTPAATLFDRPVSASVARQLKISIQ